MELILLVIPATLFVLVCIAVYVCGWLFPIGDTEEERKGKFGELSRIVSVLMTARAGIRRVDLSVYRRVTSLRTYFDETGLTFEIPLVTRSQIKNRDDLREIASSHGRDVPVIFKR